MYRTIVTDNGEEVFGKHIFPNTAVSSIANISAFYTYCTSSRVCLHTTFRHVFKIMVGAEN